MQKTKVTFIEPTGAYSNVFARFMTIPLLGPLYLGTMAKQAGYDVTIINENILGRHVSFEELKEADILCLTCLTATINRGKQIAFQYKQIRKSYDLPARTILGGIHASMAPDDCVDDFDQVVIGEGETVLLDLLAGKISDKLVRTRALQDLDQLPVPDFTLVKEHKKISIWPVMTSRGCPYNCNFCSVTEMFGRKYRKRSIDHIIKEIMSYPNKNIFFADDHFAADPKQTNALLDAMLESGFKLPWSTQIRADVTKNAPILSKMRKAGCRTVFIGFESINPESLVEIEKNQSVDDIRNSIKVFKKADLMVHGMFMLGNDSDSKGIFRETSDFCIKSGISSVQYMILTPLPGTTLYRKLKQEKRLLHQDWDFYDAMHVVFEPKNFAPDELQQGMIRCFSEFYTLSRAFKDAFVTMVGNFFRLLRRIYASTGVRLASLRSAATKFYGKGIVKSWIRYNQSYLRYLMQTAKPGQIGKR